MDIKVLTAPRVFVPFCAQLMVTMEVEFATVKTVGRARNVTYQLPNVKCQHARVMVDVLKENVIAIGDGKDLFAIKVRNKIYQNNFKDNFKI